MSFVHLRTKSHYTLLGAVPKVSDLVGRAKELGFMALALTDKNNLYGAIEFYKECKENEIQPIIGVELSLQKEGGEKRKDFSSVVILARDIDGYKNLLQLVTSANLSSPSSSPSLPFAALEKHGQGLLAILPMEGSEISNAVAEKNTKRGEEIIKRYRDVFGEGHVFLEVRREKNNPLLESVFRNTMVLAEAIEVKAVATNNVHYLLPEDAETLAVIRKIENSGYQDYDGMEGRRPDLSFLSETEMQERFNEHREALGNTAIVAGLCSLELPLGQWVFPNLETRGESHDDKLKRVVYEGLAKRNIKHTPEVEKRIEYELSVIKQKGYAPYFLVVADLLRFAHDHGILTTTRGSAAGSLVSYLAGITTVDPLKYLLPFERFLNPERPSAPDADMDIADNRRDEMIEYARQKYGKEHVAQIGTFGTMMARGAVRDVARALGYPYGLGDRIAKLIPFGSQGFPMTIDHALESSPELKELSAKDEEVSRIITMAKKIEGNVRHISIHAAGVVISPTPLTDFTPLQLDPKTHEHVITQYDMYTIEDAGLLKFDFLGIRNLAILADSVRLVKDIRGMVIDIENIPLDDKKTFEMLARGDTGATFQLNGAGMTRHLKELLPTRIEDINVMVALYRPGPMDNINEYIARKHGRHPVTYLHPKMKNYLDTTFGVLVYQDDLLMTAIEVAGYSWGEVDKFRKAVGKKIPEEMAKQHIIFVEGCQRHGGTTKEKAEQIWNLFEPFQGYGFNKAHAASYGKVAYQTAYMKANFPGEYMTAVLTAEAGNIDTIAEMVSECKKLHIPVLPPDINESFEDFTLIQQSSGDAIRFGLKSIKNFGEGIARSVIEERARQGKFKTLENFLSRVKDKNLNKKSIESLILSGSLDSLGERGAMLGNIEDILAYVRSASSESKDQTSLFSDLILETPPLVLKEATPMNQDEKLRYEKELLGLYISGHPLDKYREKLKGRSMTIEKIRNELHPGMVAVASGLLEEAKPILTKNGERMLFLKLEDYTGTIEAVVFPRTYAEYKNLFIPGTCIAVKGKLSNRNNTLSLIADAAKAL